MKTYLTYGFAMALAGSILAVVLYLLGFHSDPAKLPTAQIIGMCGGLLIAVVSITLGTKARRAELSPMEEFSYGSAFATGFMIVLFASLFNIVSAFAYAKFINPDFVDVIVQAEVQKLEAKGLSADRIQGAEKMIRTMSTPLVQAIFSFIGGLVFGTVISLITAAFLKRPAAPSRVESEPPPTLA